MHVEWASIFISYVRVSFHLHRILNPGTLVRSTHITHRKSWKVYQLDGFRNFPTKKDTKSRYLMGKNTSFCRLHPLAITFCIGTKQSHNPRHMYSTAGIAFQWNLLNLTLTCYTTVLGLHEALHKLAIWHQAARIARIARNMSSTSCWEDERNFKRTFFCLQIAPMRTTLTQTLLHSWQRMMLVHHELAITSTSRKDATGIAGLRYWTFETCWYEVPC